MVGVESVIYSLTGTQDGIGYLISFCDRSLPGTFHNIIYLILIFTLCLLFSKKMSKKGDENLDAFSSIVLCCQRFCNDFWG